MKKFFLATMAVLMVFGFSFSANSAGLDKAMFSFTFDDGLASLYNTVLPVLKSNNIPATAYIVTKYIGTSGYITIPQLWEIGWFGVEIGNHTQNHQHWAALTNSQMLAEIVNAQNDLKKLGIFSSGAFTPPFGDPYDYSGYPGLYDRMIAVINQSNLVTSSRIPWDDTDTLNSVASFNPLAINSWQLINPRNFADAKALIDEAVATKSYLVFTSHNVSSSYVAGELNLSVFKSVVQYVVTLKNQGKLDIVTVSRGTAKMVHQKSLP